MTKTAIHLATAILLMVALPASGRAQVTTLPARETPLTADAAERFSVGTAEGDEWEMFDNVAAVAFDAAGNLYVLDRGNARVQVFGPDGRFLRQIGKKGGGPGELQLPVGMTVARDGSVIVLDLARGAFSYFSGSGEFLRNAHFEEGRPLPGIVAHPAGGVVYLGSNFGPMRGDELAAPSDSSPLLWRRSAEAEGDVLLRVKTARPTIRQSGSASNRQVMVGPPPMFTPTVRWALLPNAALAVADDETHTVRVYNRDGALQRTIRGPAEPAPVTESLKEKAREQRRAMSASGGAVSIRAENTNGRTRTSVGGSQRAEVGRMLANMTFAETVPVIRSIAADREGRLWIERIGADPLEPGPIDIVDSRGVYSGTLRGHEIPDAFGPTRLAAYIVEDEETGIDRVVVRQLPW